MASNKKKKTARACEGCQKSHLTCDDNRPCSRCIKRGLADQCRDGHRKKPKYILEDDFQSNSANSEFNVLNELIGTLQPGTLQQPTLGNDLTDNTLDTQLPYSNSTENTNVYSQITQPYPYEIGYKHLINYLKFNENFTQNDKLRIFKAISEFRPSLLSLQINLSNHDEIFVEQSLRRSMIDLSELIKCISAPTVVWRRTGEILLVGDEFQYIVGYDRDSLINTSTYIYQLMEPISAVEYWQLFAKHAFDSAKPTVNTYCILNHQNGNPIPCTFSFTIKKDIFDIPSYIIGTWLPILPTEPDDDNDDIEQDLSYDSYDNQDKLYDDSVSLQPKKEYSDTSNQSPYFNPTLSMSMST
ncbi:hypothetical protein E3P92_01636 [Wallemia ichthyophaga]|uniref:Transcription activator of gluconeogenesis ERT1 n=1 Tax=Wallemia ichthyophaga TaxID=245174 RepID=A0A4V4M1U4_WALIC|nr:hypothetical protein E3P91_01476 [Wallemia ichthyophaga]TIA81533.1 hypothetical protein E3P98_02006 [Wallemia ichthyophaga]TIB04464.1 hypothetical protein E3P96_01635 [Wallemia ichthyophaga]TIB12084.1 hypothetical protein E3P90_02164 [Wallemia ichthyophaga]TIB13297.1 hypothetical protein E3P93_02001 [Wallemia ichthyophaga]